MGIKRGIGKFGDGYKKEFGGVAAAAPIGTLIFTALFGIGTGGFGTGVAIDALNITDDQPRAGQQVSIEQHRQALANLETQREALAELGGYAPQGTSALERLIEIPQDAQANRQAAEAQQQNYRSAMNDFITSVHLDARLNEQDVQNLVTEFKAEHGKISEVTDFRRSIDYADLNVTRAWAENRDFASEFEKAKAVNERAAGYTPSNFSTKGALGTALAPWLLLILTGMAGGPLRRWANEKPKPKKTKSGYQH